MTQTESAEEAYRRKIIIPPLGRTQKAVIELHAPNSSWGASQGTPTLLKKFRKDLRLSAPKR